MILSIDPGQSGGLAYTDPDGYGHLKSKGDAGDYGNGAVFVNGYKNIIPLVEKEE